MSKTIALIKSLVKVFWKVPWANSLATEKKKGKVKEKFHFQVSFYSKEGKFQ